MSKQILFHQINSIKKRRRKGDPESTTLIMELTDGSLTHRTCFDFKFRIVKDEVIDYPDEEDWIEQDDLKDWRFKTEAE